MQSQSEQANCTKVHSIPFTCTSIEHTIHIASTIAITLSIRHVTLPAAVLLNPDFHHCWNSSKMNTLWLMLLLRFLHHWSTICDVYVYCCDLVLVLIYSHALTMQSTMLADYSIVWVSVLFVELVFVIGTMLISLLTTSSCAITFSRWCGDEERPLLAGMFEETLENISKELFVRIDGAVEIDTKWIIFCVSNARET